MLLWVNDCFFHSIYYLINYVPYYVLQLCISKYMSELDVAVIIIGSIIASTLFQFFDSEMITDPYEFLIFEFLK